MLSLPSAATSVAPKHEALLPAQKAAVANGRRRLWFFAALSMVAGAISTGALEPTGPVSPHLHGGSPGYRQASGGQNLRWHQPALTIYLDDSLGRLGPETTSAVMQAFGRWLESEPQLPKLSFDTGKTSSTPKQDGKSTVSYGRIVAAGHERDLAITVTYAKDRTGEIIEADIILNSLYPMGVLTLTHKAQTAGASQPRGATEHDGKLVAASAAEVDDCHDRYDVQNLTTHEAGHFFGLGEDRLERGAAMFQTIDQCETHKRLPLASDVSALGTLYAVSQDPPTAAAGPQACSFVAGHTPPGTAWASSLFLGLLLARRRRCG